MADKNSTDMGAKKILDSYKKPVWKEIKKYLKRPIYPTTFKIPSKYQKDISNYWKIVEEYPKRQGKYFRPALLLLTTEAMGQKMEKAIKTATAIQISEEWLLIHDDIEDQSLVRRGKPTLHELYSPELALNAGDSLHVIMWKIILDNKKNLGTEKTFKIANEFYKILSRTVDGQGIEIAWKQKGRKGFQDRDWYFIADGKTAYYTTTGPMVLGGIIANANQKQINLLANFGLYLGRCFQLTDDLLDLTSNFRGPGQRTASDLYEGKRTIMLSHLVRNVNKKDRKKLLNILKKSIEQKTEREVKWILKKMDEYQSIEYGKKIAKKLKVKALNTFKKDLKFLFHQPARDNLETLTHFVLERKY